MKRFLLGKSFANQPALPTLTWQKLLPLQNLQHQHFSREPTLNLPEPQLIRLNHPSVVAVSYRVFGVSPRDFPHSCEAGVSAFARFACRFDQVIKDQIGQRVEEEGVLRSKIIPVVTIRDDLLFPERHKIEVREGRPVRH